MNPSQLQLLVPIAALAVVVVAQTRVRERSQRAALALTIGGGLEGGFGLAMHFVGARVPELHALSPLVQVGAAGAVGYGLVTLLDELNPKLGNPLPPALEKNRAGKPNVFLHGFWGFFGVVAVGASMRMMPSPALIAAVVAIAAALYGSVWLGRRGGLVVWILERRPELVVWTFVHHLTVVNRRYGTRTTYWSARLGLTTKVFITVPAAGEVDAQQLAATVAQFCPGIAVGFTPELEARYKTDPASMRR